MKTKNTFVFNLEWAEALDGCEPEVVSAVYYAVVHYARTGQVLDIENPVARIAFRFIRLELDRTLKRKAVSPQHVTAPEENAPAPASDPVEVVSVQESPQEEAEDSVATIQKNTGNGNNRTVKNPRAKHTPVTQPPRDQPQSTVNFAYHARSSLHEPSEPEQSTSPAPGAKNLRAPPSRSMSIRQRATNFVFRAKIWRWRAPARHNGPQPFSCMRAINFVFRARSLLLEIPVEAPKTHIEINHDKSR